MLNLYLVCVVGFRRILGVQRGKITATCFQTLIYNHIQPLNSSSGWPLINMLEEGKSSWLFVMTVKSASVSTRCYDYCRSTTDVN